MTQYTDMQLDALRELANIGSGTASTALSSMLGRSVDISVPNALVLPMAQAVETIGDPESDATGVVLGIVGDMQATVLLLFTPNDARLMCGLLGVEVDSEIGVSALMEIGNIVGTSYINALAEMTGMALEPTPRPRPPTCWARSSRPFSPSARPAPMWPCCWTPTSSSRARTAPCRSCWSRIRGASSCCWRA